MYGELNSELYRSSLIIEKQYGLAFGPLLSHKVFQLTFRHHRNDDRTRLDDKFAQYFV